MNTIHHAFCRKKTIQNHSKENPQEIIKLIEKEQIRTKICLNIIKTIAILTTIKISNVKTNKNNQKKPMERSLQQNIV